MNIRFSVGFLIWLMTLVSIWMPMALSMSHQEGCEYYTPDEVIDCWFGALVVALVALLVVTRFLKRRRSQWAAKLTWV